MIDNRFYLFGSENSRDCDILVNIDTIPKNIDKAHDICKKFNDELSLLLPDKQPLNCNLITLKNNKIINCFKGTCNEINNSLYYTYNLHKQFYPNPILTPVEQDLNEKILRVARFVLTFFSRTELRKEIKEALRGNLILKLAVLKKIDFTKMTEFSLKKESKENIYKIIAYQLGQYESIKTGYEAESYTKNGIIKKFPDLENLINRRTITENDLNILNYHLYILITYIEDNITNLRLTESI